MDQPEEQLESKFRDENEEIKSATKMDNVPPSKAEMGPEIEEKLSPRLTRSQSRVSPLKEVEKVALMDKNKREMTEHAVSEAQDSGSNKKRRV